jgi:hypothetical protein
MGGNEAKSKGFLLVSAETTLISRETIINNTN